MKQRAYALPTLTVRPARNPRHDTMRSSSVTPRCWAALLGSLEPRRVSSGNPRRHADARDANTTLAITIRNNTTVTPVID